MKLRARVLRGVAVASVAVAVGCGGGGPTDSDYPSVTGNYGAGDPIIGGAGTPGDASATQRWIAADGSVGSASCTALISIPVQNGADFSGTIERTGLTTCRGSGTFTGQVTRTGQIRLTLTQARWAECTATATPEYTGVVNNGSILATGRVAVQCDNGAAFTIEEQFGGSLPRPPGTQ